MDDQSRKVFVTGASSGIGLETTLCFGERGWDVIATKRHSRTGGPPVRHQRVRTDGGDTRGLAGLPPPRSRRAHQCRLDGRADGIPALFGLQQHQVRRGGPDRSAAVRAEVARHQGQTHRTGRVKTGFYGRSLDPADSGSEPAAVARTIYRSATDGRARLGYVVGSDARLLLVLRRLLPESAFFRLFEQSVLE